MSELVCCVGCACMQQRLICLCCFQEQEQSAFEHHEKEQETFAGESVIEREIREQQQRENEIRSLRHSISAGALDSAPAAVNQQQTPVNQQPNAARPLTNSAPPVPSSAPPRAAPVVEAPPPRASHTPVMSKSVTYEAAISTFAHPGENMIAREMREQREREDELRTHWKELGFEIPSGSQEPPDTPFNRPDPHPATTQRAFLPSVAVTAAVPQSRSQAPPTATANSAPGGPALRRDSVGSQGSNSVTDGGRHRVQPYTTADDEEEEHERQQRFIFQPHNETPVEREIRMAREREEALRRERGLPTLSPDGGATNNSRVSATADTTRPRQSPTTTAAMAGRVEEDKHTMKRFAHNRLQYEMQKENQRELALRNEGKISTTSEDRSGGRASYRDIMSPDSGPPPTPRTPTAQPVRTAALSSEVRLPNGTAGAPLVRSQQLKHAEADGAGWGDKRHTVVESLIEQELREQQQREEELR